jgi:SRSO17 transposase
MPDDVEFAAKPKQAQAMLERAVAAGMRFAWFTADEAYGQNRGLRQWCEQRDIAYVMATRRDHEVPSGLHTSTRVDQPIARVRPGEPSSAPPKPQKGAPPTVSARTA